MRLRRAIPTTAHSALDHRGAGHQTALSYRSRHICLAIPANQGDRRMWKDRSIGAIVMIAGIVLVNVVYLWDVVLGKHEGLILLGGKAWVASSSRTSCSSAAW